MMNFNGYLDVANRSIELATKEINVCNIGTIDKEFSSIVLQLVQDVKKLKRTSIESAIRSGLSTKVIAYSFKLTESRISQIKKEMKNVNR